MNKLRTLPVYVINGTDFIVDVNKQVLREAERPANEISFISDMADHADFYLLRYDNQTRRPAVVNPDHEAEIIILPPLVALDPEGMAEKYGVPLEEILMKTDFEVIVDPYLLAQRKRDVLPVIDLAGESFTVDIRLQELRHAEFFFPVLSLKSFEPTDDGWHYEAFYEAIMKQVVNIDPKLLELPDSIVKIRIPNELGLDPVGSARQYGLDERELLRRYPIQKALKAEIIPLSETALPRLIRQNKEALQSAHQANMQRLKPKPRHRF